MLIELLVILTLVLLNGLFAGAEIAIVNVEPTQLRKLGEEGSGRARCATRIRAQPERFFATVQIVITVVGAAAAAYGGARFARDLSPLLVPLVGESADEFSLGVVVVIISFFSLVLGELVPKSIALRHSQRYALFIAPLLLALSSIARPLVWLLTATSNLVLRAFGDRATFSQSRLSPNDLQDLVAEASDVGSLHPRVADIASRVLQFGELSASKVMVARTQVVGIRRGSSQDEIRSIVLETGHSRLPVYADDHDEMVGYILYKDLLPLAWEGRLIVLDDLIRPPCFVAGSLPAVDVLHLMRERRAHLAFVVDAHGGIAGIVTLDDLVEELVGEVFGEMHAHSPPSIRRERDGTVSVAGDATIRDLNRDLELELPEGPGYSTIAGLVMAMSDHVPLVGESVRLQGNLEAFIESASDRAVLRVRLLLPGHP